MLTELVSKLLGSEKRDRILALDTIVRTAFGYPGWRNDIQRRATEALVEGKDVIALLPTGMGKSLIFQAAAIAREGTGLVISPTKSLMEDQVAALRNQGIQARAYYGDLSWPEKLKIRNELAASELELLFVTPESASGALSEIIEGANISVIAADEAHLVSQWGNSFRPEYLPVFRDIRKVHPFVPIVAVTATARRTLLLEIAQILDMSDVEEFILPMDRPEIQFEVVKLPNLSESPKYSQVNEEFCRTAVLQVRRMLELHGKYAKGIVYTPTNSLKQKISQALLEISIPICEYDKDLPAIERRRIGKEFKQPNGPIQVVCATGASFGMGIDVPEVRFIINAGLPDSIETLYQQAGRCGRDGNSSTAVTIVSTRSHERRVWGLIWQENRVTEEPQVVESRDDKWNHVVEWAFKASCRRRVLLEYLEETPFAGSDGNPKCCDVCAAGQAPRKVETKAPAAVASHESHSSGGGALFHNLYGRAEIKEVFEGTSRVRVHFPDFPGILSNQVVVRSVLRSATSSESMHSNADFSLGEIVRHRQWGVGEVAERRSNGTFVCIFQGSKVVVPGNQLNQVDSPISSGVREESPIRGRDPVSQRPFSRQSPLPSMHKPVQDSGALPMIVLEAIERKDADALCDAIVDTLRSSSYKSDSRAAQLILTGLFNRSAGILSKSNEGHVYLELGLLDRAQECFTGVEDDSGMRMVKRKRSIRRAEELVVAGSFVEAASIFSQLGLSKRAAELLRNG
jgi:RecQ family ATP-dependent DNA helicase